MSPILLVDDSREDMSLATRVFSQCRILNPLRMMHSGKECIGYFKSGDTRATDSEPCIVFLDLMMSPISGIEVLRQLRDTPAAREAIFIMLSGASDYSMVRDGYQLGAATFFVKPLTCEEVMRTFKALRGVTVRPHSDGYEVVCAARSPDAHLSEKHAVHNVSRP